MYEEVNMNNKKKYIEFCESHDVPLFAKPFWLDLVCEYGNWDAVISEKNRHILGVMPFYYKRKGFLSMPPLTPYLGPYIAFPEDMKYAKRLSHEHFVMQDLIKQLPTFKLFNQRFHPYVSNWLPFYWNNYEQTTRYTYVLSDLQNQNDVRSFFNNNVKRNIKKAEAKIEVRSLHNEEIDNYYEIIRRNRKPNYSLSFLRSLIIGCQESKCGKTFAAFDPDGTLLASLFVVWDKQTAYYILGARNPEKQTQQAMSLLMKNAIEFASEKAMNFDFEGSMIELVERFFRTFGAKQVSYLNVYKVKSPLLKIAVCMADLLNKKVF